MLASRSLAFLIAVMLACAPLGDAFAKAGKGTSTGSRGNRTADRPIERSYTQPSAPAPMAQPAAPAGQQPMYNPSAVRQQPGMAAPAPMPVSQPGFFQRNPFVTGMLGGLVGAGIGSMLFGHSPALAAASDAAPMASMLGTLFQLLLIGGLIWFAVRLFRSRSQVQTQPQEYQDYQRHEYEPVSYQPSTMPSSAPRVEKEFEPTQADKDAFGAILMGVQKAWSDGNPHALRQFATPEVLGWMNEDLTQDQSKGQRNVVEDVQLLKGDVTESWSEGAVDYATAVMTFRCKDYTVRLDNGQVVDGDASRLVEHTEAWTYVRAQGGRWLLSAIEQV